MAPSLSSWSDLPQEILKLIFDCTRDPVDVLRCATACKSWHPVALQEYRKFFPLCLIQDVDDINGNCFLFNLSTKEKRKIRLVKAEGRQICCFSNSWLLTIDHHYFDCPYRMNLINIFSGKEIALPSIMSLRPFNYPTLERFGVNHEWKLFLLNCPSSSADCVVVLVHNNKTLEGDTKVSFCKPGDEKWTDWGTSFFQQIYDPVPLEGYIYATVSKNRPILVMSEYYNYDLPPVRPGRPNLGLIPIPEVWQSYYYDETFIVKSFNGDCLLLVGYRGEHPDGKLFEIFELNVYTREFWEVKDLSGYALFLSPTGDGNHILAKAGNSETWFKANCIYYCNHWEQNYSVFDLVTWNSEIVPCPCFGEIQNYRRSLWIKP